MKEESIQHGLMMKKIGNFIHKQPSKDWFQCFLDIYSFGNKPFR